MAALGFALETDTTAQQNGYDRYNTTLGQTLGAVAGENWNFNPMSSIGTYRSILSAQRESAINNIDRVDRKQLNKEYSDLIQKYTMNWEVDRLAKIDIILLKLAMTELDHMSTIPVKVSMNEYIDLSKHFSTPKSKNFINGVLDRVVADWKAEGRLSKTGRGLME